MWAWLLRFSSPLYNMLFSFGLKKIWAAIADYYYERREEKKKAAELELAKQELKKEMEAAGEDEKSQEDAYNKFFNRTR